MKVFVHLSRSRFKKVEFGPFFKMIKLPGESNYKFMKEVFYYLYKYFDIIKKKGHTVYTRKDANWVIVVSKKCVSFDIETNDPNNESFKKVLKIIKKLSNDHEIYLEFAKYDDPTSGEYKMSQMIEKIVKGKGVVIFNY